MAAGAILLGLGAAATGWTVLKETLRPAAEWAGTRALKALGPAGAATEEAPDEAESGPENGDGGSEAR